MEKNNLLGIECLFRFPSREVKDGILTNYDNMGGSSNLVSGTNGMQVERFDDDEEEDVYNKKLGKEKPSEKETTKELITTHKVIWTEDEDNILINSYE